MTKSKVNKTSELFVNGLQHALVLNFLVVQLRSRNAKHICPKHQQNKFIFTINKEVEHKTKQTSAFSCECIGFEFWTSENFVLRSAQEAQLSKVEHDNSSLLFGHLLRTQKPRNNTGTTSAAKTIKQ